MFPDHISHDRVDGYQTKYTGLTNTTLAMGVAPENAGHYVFQSTFHIVSFGQTYYLQGQRRNIKSSNRITYRSSISGKHCPNYVWVERVRERRGGVEG